MEMPMPDNTLPMMTGFGQFGPLEMGGMFSVVKVREGLGGRATTRIPAGTSIRKGRSPTNIRALSRSMIRPGNPVRRSRPPGRPPSPSSSRAQNRARTHQH